MSAESGSAPSTGSGPRTRSTRELVEISLMVALASVLSQVAFLRWPQGGSVTFGANIPIWIVARRHGVGPGLLAGLGLGVVNLILGSGVVHPIQGVLDYPLAFGALGLAGLTVSVSAGIFLAATVRFLCHSLAGLMFFTAYAPAGFDPTMYVALYNGSLVIPDTLIALWGFRKLEERVPGLLDRRGRATGRAPREDAP